MTTLSCKTPVGKSVTYADLYAIKKDCETLATTMDTKLLDYLYYKLDTINNDVLKQNKMRYKQYQRQKYGATDMGGSSSGSAVGDHMAWRTPAPKISGLSVQLAQADKVKLGLNRELNKLSGSNIDMIYAAILEIITDFVVTYVIETGPMSLVQTDFIAKYDVYLDDLWQFVINKLLTQPTFTDIYLRFLNRLIITPDADLYNLVILKLNPVIEPGALEPVQDVMFVSMSFGRLEQKKQKLIAEMIAFLKNGNFLADVLHELIGDMTTCESVFGALGRFVKYFSEVDYGNRSKKLSATERKAYDVLLVALYDNFKFINDLLQWEPVNVAELEKRVFFTIGFFQDNTRFIQNLDMDFYRDVECQLDGLRHSSTIPVSIKYKLFDCIDNFISSRHK
jgi:hypothetical protein